MSFIYTKKVENTNMEWDVVVCGGGSAGIAAALSAARNGARVALIEKESYLGGTATGGLVCSFAYGYHDKERQILSGIFSEIQTVLCDRKAIIKNKRHGWEPFNAEQYKLLLFQLMEENNVTVYTQSLIVDVIIRENRIYSLIIANKDGIYAIKGKNYVDATGDADIAFYSGIPCTIGRQTDRAIQPSTMMFLVGGVDYKAVGESQKRGYWLDEGDRGYVNATGFSEYVEKGKKSGCLTIPRDTISSIFTIPLMQGVVGVNFGRVYSSPGFNPVKNTAEEYLGLKQVQEAHSFLKAYVPGFAHSFIISSASKLGRRETRRIIGEYTLNEEDIKQQRQFDDVIAQYCYMIDIHSPDNEFSTLYKIPRGNHYDIPYRCLISSIMENLIVAGRCISCTHDALGAVRVQPLCIAIGEAAGMAASMCSLYDYDLPSLDVKALQSRLIDCGAILS